LCRSPDTNSPYVVGIATKNWVTQDTPTRDNFVIKVAKLLRVVTDAGRRSKLISTQVFANFGVRV